jgi:hypothetical protein
MVDFEFVDEEDKVTLCFDHMNSFEADSYIKSGMTPTPIPICFMNCGYASGWVSSAWGMKIPCNF